VRVRTDNTCSLRATPLSPRPCRKPTTRWSDEWRATMRLAAPLVGANLLQMAVFAVDVIFIARLGPVALAASSLSVSLFGLLDLAARSAHASPLIAAIGARRTRRARSAPHGAHGGLGERDRGRRRDGRVPAWWPVDAHHRPERGRDRPWRCRSSMRS